MHGTNSQTNKSLGSPNIGCIKSFYTNFFSEEKIVLVSESFDVDFILDQGNVWTKNMTKGHNLMLDQLELFLTTNDDKEV